MTRRLALTVGLALTIFLDALPGMPVLGSRGVRFALFLAALALIVRPARPRQVMDGLREVADPITRPHWSVRIGAG